MYLEVFKIRCNYCYVLLLPVEILKFKCFSMKLAPKIAQYDPINSIKKKGFKDSTAL